MTVRLAAYNGRPMQSHRHVQDSVRQSQVVPAMTHRHSIVVSRLQDRHTWSTPLHQSIKDHRHFHRSRQAFKLQVTPKECSRRHVTANMHKMLHRPQQISMLQLIGQQRGAVNLLPQWIPPCPKVFDRLRRILTTETNAKGHKRRQWQVRRHRPHQRLHHRQKQDPNERNVGR